MATAPISFRRPAPRMTTDPARQNQNNSGQSLAETGIGTVGHTDTRTALPEGTPAWVRWEQGELLVEVTTTDGDQIVARVGCECDLFEGRQVVLVYPGGEPNDAIIVGALHSTLEPAPSSVAGVSTGAGAAGEKGVRPPGATWEFKRFGNGRMLAFQTNDQDINIWAGAGIHMKATSGAIHLDGTTHLGAKPVSPPLGSVAAPGLEEIEGVPSVPFVPVPYAGPTPQGPVGVPYVGSEDGIVRAKELFQSGIAIDPVFWANYTAIDAVARAINPLLPPLPTNLYSAISGAAGPGAAHTASDPPTP